MERRVLSAFQLLSTRCTPRVMSAYLRTLWNGWTTDRRFRNVLVARGVSIRPCVLGCEQGTDALEHYLRCPVFRDFIHAPHPSGLGLLSHSIEYVFLIANDMSQEEK
eukprot:1331057-Karenia_brevis.AAC.1